MQGTPQFFWKNFRLGTELQVSGTFLYNALYYFDKMRHFYYEDECFEFLYNVSVGIERLEKVAIILLEHHEKTNQVEFEKSLISHNHLDLLSRIKKLRPLSIGKNHILFLKLITEFYTSIRYNRYGIDSVYKVNQDKESLIKYIENGLGIKINTDPMTCTFNDSRIKKHIGKIVGKIAEELYSVIYDRAHELNIYTYEIAYASKAFKIFISKEYTFEKELLFKKEILIQLLHRKIEDGFFNFISNITPINLDEYDIHEYVKYLLGTPSENTMEDELESIYEDQPFDKERTKLIDYLGGDISFGEPDEEEF